MLSTRLRDFRDFNGTPPAKPLRRQTSKGLSGIASSSGGAGPSFFIIRVRLVQQTHKGGILFNRAGSADAQPPRFAVGLAFRSTNRLARNDDWNVEFSGQGLYAFELPTISCLRVLGPARSRIERSAVVNHEKPFTGNPSKV